MLRAAGSSIAPPTIYDAAIAAAANSAIPERRWRIGVVTELRRLP